MTKRKDRASDVSELRRKAERVLNPDGKIERSGIVEPVDRYRQELEIHQVELELQNEELRTARIELEAGLDRYTQLFDFAPIGYALLDREGVIRALNHVGAGHLYEP